MTATTSDASGNWQVANSGSLIYDVTGTTGSVDSYAVIVNFMSDDTADTAATDHLLVTGSLPQSYDLSQLDELTLNAGGVGFGLN